MRCFDSPRMPHLSVGITPENVLGIITGHKKAGRSSPTEHWLKVILSHSSAFDLFKLHFFFPEHESPNRKTRDPRAMDHPSALSQFAGGHDCTGFPRTHGLRRVEVEMRDSPNQSTPVTPTLPGANQSLNLTWLTKHLHSRMNPVG
jgi:hypothetical protein